MKTGGSVGGRSLARIAAALALFAALAGSAHAAVFNGWSATLAMNTARTGHIAAALPGGNVLVAGGVTTGLTTTATAERYSLVSGTWATTAPMSTPRAFASAVILRNGDVLVVGGSTSLGAFGALNTGEVYDPTTNGWTSVSNTMSSPRNLLPAAALLPNGKVLVAGGADANGTPVATADLYDPVTNQFVPTGAPMHTARAYASAWPLPNGKVLVAGGQGSNGAPVSDGEVYDPVADTWTAVANAMPVARMGAAINGLPSGKVLIVGGETSTSPTTSTSSTTVYDPATNAFSAGPPMASSRVFPGIAALADGRVLVAGGVTYDSGAPALLSTSELYDPSTNSWTSVGDLPLPDVDLTLTALPGSRVLAAGGITSLTTTVTANAALFTPATVPDPPQSVSATAGNRSAVVTFAPPASDGGLPVQHYTITATTGQRVTTSDSRTVATVTGLTNGKGVNFSVTATNAMGTGPASALSAAVTPLGPPQVTLVRVPRRLRLRAFLRGMTFVVAPDEPASWAITLRGAVNRATIARAFNLTLAHKTLALGAGRRTVRLKPRRALVGHPRRATVELVIVATAQSGASSTTTRKIRLTG